MARELIELALPPQLYREVHDTWPKELEGFCWSATGIRFSIERLIQNEKYLNWIPWHGFRLPFRLECDGNLIDPPPAAPNTSVLEVEPVGGPEDEEVERPVTWFELDREATAELEGLIQKDFSIINTELLEAWPFFRAALEYLVKAILTDPYHSPAEQFLWHVTALEALGGDVSPGGDTEFDYVFETLFNPAMPPEVILELAAGVHIFQLMCNERLELVFYQMPGATLK